MDLKTTDTYIWWKFLVLLRLLLLWLLLHRNLMLIVHFEWLFELLLQELRLDRCLLCGCGWCRHMWRRWCWCRRRWRFWWWWWWRRGCLLHRNLCLLQVLKWIKSEDKEKLLSFHSNRSNSISCLQICLQFSLCLLYRKMVYFDSRSIGLWAFLVSVSPHPMVWFESDPLSNEHRLYL